MSNGTGTVNCVVRGSTVMVTAAFTDQYGAPAEPASVTVGFDYVQGGTRLSVEYPMVFNYFTGLWNYSWDSSAVDPCLVYGTVFTDPAVLPVYATDFSFALEANLANLGALP